MQKKRKTAKKKAAAGSALYSDRIIIRVPPELNERIADAARLKGTRPSEFVRQAILAALKEMPTMTERSVSKLLSLGFTPYELVKMAFDGGGTVSITDQRFGRLVEESIALDEAQKLKGLTAKMETLSKINSVEFPDIKTREDAELLRVVDPERFRLWQLHNEK